uniref:LR2 n=1 Tax=Griffithsia pacifica TaxID=35689 RepID=A0A291FEB0_GRIPA|nr:LR2 [Griffithsia pacifica]5Y6P_ew Chain ew, LR2 [Griffithsia pacifica]5Y6P_ex Chain ex, LR2 [Griffithsia pacifica]5Y6P_fd Chain fd, LR2 [Griffithsia pacifica]5Y6P_fz Chain fz, LR2 [Griffithsia pacifica]
MASKLAFSSPLNFPVRTLLPTNTCVAANSSRTSVACPFTTSMAFSSIDRILTADPVAFPNGTESVIRATYIQVFGNAHVMDSEREELATAESNVCRTGNVREFVRAIVLSENYKSRFFYSVSQYRFIELMFKHILGRAPESRAEYAEAMAVYNTKGYEPLVSWFVDSLEYNENFGSWIVPYGIYQGCYSSNELFNRSVAMRLAPGCSDKGRSAMLQYCVLSGDSPNWLSISKALPAGTEKGTGLCIGGHWQSSQRNKQAPVKGKSKIPGGVIVTEE